MKKNSFNYLIIFIITIITTNFTFKITGNCETKIRNLLTQTEAVERANQVDNVSYSLFYELNKTDKFFKGEVNIFFNLLNNKKSLRIDFENGKVFSILNNSQKIEYEYNNSFIKIKGNNLKKGTNNLKIKFSHDYSNDGTGLHRFEDLIDKNIYFYTNLEPFYTNKVFPCFDQPDIKADYTLEVKAPSNWVIISSVRENEVIKFSKKFNLWKFPKTLKFSTYLFSLIAGPYTSWKSKYNNMELRLFARKSISNKVDSTYWFKITKKGLKFFEEYFNYPYPFFKYDQIIVPDFNISGMENIAAVTFNERFTWSGTPTRNIKQYLAGTLLHEMAHMWFGNLVTMKWWNDLWLNESFATYIGAKALSEIEEFKDAFKDSFSYSKENAYWADQLVTTHPITSEVKNTNEAFANFDAITYGKGASVLKLYDFYLGHNIFRDGVRNYFNKFAFKNSTLEDFILSLEESSKLNLKSFSKEWLKTAGLNTISVEFKCSGKNLSTILINQTAPDNYPYLRTHKSRIALLKLQNNKAIVFDSFSYEYKGKTTKLSFKNKKCPEAIFPNYMDHDYVKISLDNKSNEFFQHNLSKIESSFLRQMIWMSNWHMLRDYKIDLKIYMNSIFKHLNLEKDYDIASFLTNSFHYGTYKYIQKADTLSNNKSSYALGLSNFIWNKLNEPNQSSDFIKLWVKTYSDAAIGENSIKNLIALLYNKTNIQNLELNQNLRWKILTKLASLNYKNIKKILLKEKIKDKSSDGYKYFLTAMSAIPDLTIKTKYFNELLNPKSTYQAAIKYSIMYAIFPFHQNYLKRNFDDIFLKQFAINAKQMNQRLASKIAYKLAPAYCEEKDKIVLDSFIKSNSDLNDTILKRLKILKQENNYCISIVKKELKADSQF